MSGLKRYPNLRNLGDIDKNADLSHLYGHLQLSDIQKLGLYAAIYGRMNLFITGSAGVGKSKLMHVIAEGFYAQGLNIQFVSTTGISATQLPRGTTFHALLQLYAGETSIEIMIDKSSQNKAVITTFQELDCLVVDEVSMLQADFIDVLHEVCVNIRKSSDPFGGLQVIFLGDFAQLSPVPCKALQTFPSDTTYEMKEYRTQIRNLKYAFEHPKWSMFFPYPIHLTQVFRQSDPTFIRVLHRVRFSDLDEEDIVILKQKSIAGQRLLDQMERTKSIKLKKIQRRSLASKTHGKTYKCHKCILNMDLSSGRYEFSNLVRAQLVQQSQSCTYFDFEVRVLPLLDKYISAPATLQLIAELMCSNLLDDTVFMFAKNDKVDRRNVKQLLENELVLRELAAQDWKCAHVLNQEVANPLVKPMLYQKYTCRTEVQRENANNRARFRQWLEDQKKNCLARPEIELQLGALVMLTTNIDPQAGMVNGMRGMVVGYTDRNYPIIQFPIASMAQRTALRTKLNNCQLIKEYDQVADVMIPPYQFSCLDEEYISKINRSSEKNTLVWAHIPKAVYIQIPLRIAHALSIHKSQGLTIPKLIIDAEDIWDNGQFYVALSRASDFNSLLLLNFKLSQIKTHPKVIAYYKDMQNKFQQWQTLISNLSIQQGMTESKLYSEVVRKMYLNRFESKKEKQATIASMLIKRQKLE